MARQDMNDIPERGSRVKDDVFAVVMIAFSALLIISFFTTLAGKVGSVINDVFFGLFGAVSYGIPFFLILLALLIFARVTVHVGFKTVILLFITAFMASTIFAGSFVTEKGFENDYGFSAIALYFKGGISGKTAGLFGMYLGQLLVKLMGLWGAYAFEGLVALICILMIISNPMSRAIQDWGDRRAAKRAAEEEAEFEEQLAVEKLRMEEEKRNIRDRIEKEPDLRDRPEPHITTAYEFDYEPDYKPLNSSEIEKRRGKIVDYMNDFDDEGVPGSEYGLGNDDGFGLGDEYNGKDKKKSASKPRRKKVVPSSDMLTFDDDERDAQEEIKPVEESRPVSNAATAAASTAAAAAAINAVDNASEYSGKYKLPPISLLEKGLNARGFGDSAATLREKAAKLEETLLNFKVDATVVNVTQGPAATRYELQPKPGVKVSQILNLSDDIELNMAAKGIRMEAPIPGKRAIGIELENDSVKMVKIREIIGSSEFKEAESKITFVLGRDIAGKAIVADLKEMPHLLIAGATGSGKSVCVNSIITSILYKARPEEVKMILIDPKVVELTNYNGIPHLLIPVVTEPVKAAAALGWACAEMDERYKKFAEQGVRDLESYNAAVRGEEEDEKVMPQMVIIIDELADLMMEAPSQVEDSICRLAQKARAAGMHLIVATQRPSVDVITGVIKANIPSRIAFTVSSQFDSRTIIDMGGAEKLAGKGDMLFNPVGANKPLRVQGTFISDNEVNAVIKYVSNQVEEADYSEDVIQTIETGTSPKSNDEITDELLPEAIELVVQSGQASASMLQRRFRVGYNRAARMIDMMEERHIIGPSEGSKPRQVLITEAELEAMNNDTEDMDEF